MDDDAGVEEEAIPYVNAVDLQGWSALHYAAESGSGEAVELLVRRGAIVDLPEGTTKMSPLIVAAMNGNLPAVMALVEKVWDRMIDGEVCGEMVWCCDV